MYYVEKNKVFSEVKNPKPLLLHEEGIYALLIGDIQEGRSRRLGDPLLKEWIRWKFNCHHCLTILISLTGR